MRTLEGDIMTTKSKVAIITGASQGIGAGAVQTYLDLGYKVVATSRSIEPSNNPNVLTVQGDIGDPDTGRRVVEAAMERLGSVDTLINNAGIFIASPITNYSREQYDAAMATNVAGFFFITQEALKVMERQGSGHIVSITTALVNQPSSKLPSVLASLTKGGIQAATKSLAIEYATRGIRVNAVAPGVIKTPMHADTSTHEFLAGLHPVNRLGEIDDVVGAIRYLEGAQFVTGEIIHVDGGQAAGA
jgi:NAD(P)-dependent dehydrogenase (short-subunit alcohol dehydrogenase family)